MSNGGKLSIRDREQQALSEEAYALLGTARVLPDLDRGAVVVTNADFYHLLGTLDLQLVPSTTDSTGRPIHGLVMLEAGRNGTGLTVREALSAIGGRRTYIARYPQGGHKMTTTPQDPNFNLGPGDTPILRGTEVRWRIPEHLWPPFRAPDAPGWWPKDCNNQNAWAEMSLAAVIADHATNLQGQMNLGFLILTWLVVMLETRGGWSCRTLGLNLGNTVALAIDGKSYFTHSDSSPSAGVYQAHFTSFDLLYPDPEIGWREAAGRVRSTLQHMQVSAIFTEASSTITDSEIYAASRVMYERHYYAGTHVLVRDGQTVMSNGHPVPDAQANIKAYSLGLSSIEKQQRKLIASVLRST